MQHQKIILCFNGYGAKAERMSKLNFKNSFSYEFEGRKVMKSSLQEKIEKEY